MRNVSLMIRDHITVGQRHGTMRDGERRSANQKDFGVSVASEDVLAFAERGTATRPDQATHDTAGVTVCKVHGIGAEGVPESVNGPDISRLTWVIIERSPNLPNQIGQVGLDDERVPPKSSFVSESRMKSSNPTRMIIPRLR
jgi:hypothetical protein